jgi:hypothetical protein
LLPWRLKGLAVPADLVGPAKQQAILSASTVERYTGKKENEIFLIYYEMHFVSVAKSYMRKGFLIYVEMLKYLTIYAEVVSHI